MKKLLINLTLIITLLMPVAAPLTMTAAMSKAPMDIWCFIFPVNCGKR